MPIAPKATQDVELRVQLIGKDKRKVNLSLCFLTDHHAM
jgi:hypothetical protein